MPRGKTYETGGSLAFVAIKSPGEPADHQLNLSLHDKRRLKLRTRLWVRDYLRRHRLSGKMRSRRYTPCFNQASRSARLIVEAMEFYLQMTRGAVDATGTELAEKSGGNAICKKARLFSERGFKSRTLRKSLADLIAEPSKTLPPDVAQSIEAERPAIEASLRQIVAGDAAPPLERRAIENAVFNELGARKGHYLWRRHRLMLIELQAAMRADGWAGRTTLYQLGERLSDTLPLNEADRNAIAILGQLSDLPKRFRKTRHGPAPFQFLVQETAQPWSDYTGRSPRLNKHHIGKRGTLYDLLAELGRANGCWEGRPETFNRILQLALHDRDRSRARSQKSGK